jgi:hypothetical protein
VSGSQALPADPYLTLQSPSYGRISRVAYQMVVEHSLRKRQHDARNAENLANSMSLRSLICDDEVEGARDVRSYTWGGKFGFVQVVSNVGLQPGTSVIYSSITVTVLTLKLLHSSILHDHASLSTNVHGMRGAS